MALFLLWGMAIQMAIAFSTSGPIDGEFQPIGGKYMAGQTLTASFAQDLPAFTMVFSVAGAPTVATAIVPSGTQQEYALIIPTMIAEDVALLVDISTGTVHSTFPIGNFAIAQPTGVNSASTTSTDPAGQETTITSTPTSTPAVTPVTVFISSSTTPSASTVPASDLTSITHKSSVPAIVGGVISGIIITLVVGAVLLFVRNRRRRIRTTIGRDPIHRDRSSSELILNRFQTEPVVEDGPAPVEETTDDQPSASSRWSLRVNLGRYARRASRKPPPMPIMIPPVPPQVPQLALPINERMNLPELEAADEKENLRAREEGLLPPLPHVDFEMDEAEAVATAIAFHHQDSGIRTVNPADMDSQVRNQVIEFPPAYSAV